MQSDQKSIFSGLPATIRVINSIHVSQKELWGLIHELQEAEANGAIEFARAFAALRQVKDTVERFEKEFNKIFCEVKDVRLPAKFDEAGVPTVNLEEGFRVTVSHKLWASIKGGMKEQALTWLKENQLEDIVSETVNASTLSAVARSMAEENRELDPDLFSVSIVPTTSVTKTNK